MYRFIASVLAALGITVAVACAPPTPAINPSIPRPSIHFADHQIIPVIEIHEICTDKVNGVPTIGHWQAIVNYEGVYKLIDENERGASVNLVFYAGEKLNVTNHQPIWYFIWYNPHTGVWWQASAKVVRLPPSTCGARVLTAAGGVG